MDNLFVDSFNFVNLRNFRSGGNNLFHDDWAFQNFNNFSDDRDNFFSDNFNLLDNLVDVWNNFLDFLNDLSNDWLLYDLGHLLDFDLFNSNLNYFLDLLGHLNDLFDLSFNWN